jgi:lipoprotein NlpI
MMAHPLGETEAARNEFSAYFDQRGREAPGDWIFHVAEYLLGSMTEADFFAAAHSADAEMERGQLCETWYYVGVKQLLAGDNAAAAVSFRKCLATEVKTFNEYRFAEAELKSLN